jgi:RNA polymerase-interacting CarD/CdnL/TRCF family regulator
VAAVAVEDSLAHRNHQVLQEILEQLKRMNETIDTFTNDGFPLAQTVPTAELLASLMTAAALISKEQPRLNQQDLQGRIQAAQVLATELLTAHDRFQTETRKGRLNQLAVDH